MHLRNLQIYLGVMLLLISVIAAAQELKYSVSSDLSNPALLNGATVPNTIIWVFIDPATGVTGLSTACCLRHDAANETANTDGTHQWSYHLAPGPAPYAESYDLTQVVHNPAFPYHGFYADVHSGLGNRSAFFQIQQGTGQVPSSAPAITNIVYNPTVGALDCVITWDANDPAENVTHYLVYGSVQNCTGKAVGDVGCDNWLQGTSNPTTTATTCLGMGFEFTATPFSIHLKAVNAAGESPPTDPVMAL